MLVELDKKDMELARLRSIIRQAIWDLQVGESRMALDCLRYSGVEEAELPERFLKNDMKCPHCGCFVNGRVPHCFCSVVG